MAVPALSVSHLAKSFGGLRVITDVSFEIADQSITALIGPNGAGKTTLFNLITNLLPADSGEILFFGQPLKGMPGHKIAERGLVRTFQSARVFPGMTVLENVLTGAHRHLRNQPLRQILWLPPARREERALKARAEELLDIVGLAQFRGAPAADLPMGAQKQLEVIRALMAEPAMLLLDEPAAGLNDSETAELGRLLTAIRRSGVTLMVVEHNMSLVMGVADQVIVLDAGAIVATGAPEEIQRNPRVIEAYVGQDVA